MMYILSSYPDLQYLSVYCDQRKIRSFSGDLTVQEAVKYIVAGHGMSHETLADAVNFLTDGSDCNPLKVYSQEDYPELFI